MKKIVKNIIVFIIGLIILLGTLNISYAENRTVQDKNGTKVYLYASSTSYVNKWADYIEDGTFKYNAQTVVASHRYNKDSRYYIDDRDSPSYASCANGITISTKDNAKPRPKCTEKRYTVSARYGNCNSSGKQYKTVTAYYVELNGSSCSDKSYPKDSEISRDCLKIDIDTTTWGNCEISSNWDLNGNIDCIQKSITIHKKKYCENDEKTNCSTLSPDGSNTFGTDTTSLKGTFSASKCDPDDGSIYANNFDTCYIKVDLLLSGNTKQERVIEWPNKDITNVADTSGEKANINNTGKALNFENINTTNIIGNNRNYIFYINNIKAVSPFKNKSGKIDFELRGKDKYTKLSLNNISYNFSKPVSGNMEIEGLGIPEIGKDQKYIINLENTESNNLNLDYNSNGELNISENTVKDEIEGHKWDYFNLIENNFGKDLNTELSFSGKLDGDYNLLKAPNILTDKLKISYKLGGEDVSYFLDDFGLESNCTFETLGLKIYGSLQGDGKGDITGQESNISSMYKGVLRTKIRKNAYEIINSMYSGQYVNNIKYIEGNAIYSEVINELSENDTLIIKNGNLIIDKNITTNIGVIILKDHYDINSDYNNKGNIYVKNTVTKINAVIYADGAFMSADADGNSYSDEELKFNLTLFGSLFTRNTIGGAVIGNSSFTLPGGQETIDFDLAEKYDLNYIRKVPKTCDGNNENDYSFIIKYNPSIQTNPPKGFGK